jgi:hypothetical protein
MRVALPTLATLLLISGCGETNIQAIHRLQPTYSTYRDHLQQVTATLPPPGSVSAPVFPRPMDPPPRFNERQMNDPTATVEVLFVADPADPDPESSLHIRSPMHFCLEWTGPNNPLHPDVWGKRGGLGAECEAALKRPWLVLFRAVERRLPEVLRMEGFLVDVPSWRVVGAFPIIVQGRYRAEDMGRGPWAERAMSDIRSAFHQAARCELALQLARMPRAVFQLDNSNCEGAFLDTAVPASANRGVIVVH